MNGSKCDRLGPPVRVGALSEERVDASDQVIATSRRVAFSRLLNGDPKRIETSSLDATSVFLHPIG